MLCSISSSFVRLDTTKCPTFSGYAQFTMKAMLPRGIAFATTFTLSSHSELFSLSGSLLVKEIVLEIRWRRDKRFDI